MPAQIPPRQNMYNQQYIPNQPNIPNIPKQVMPPQQKYNQNYPNNIQQIIIKIKENTLLLKISKFHEDLNKE